MKHDFIAGTTPSVSPSVSLSSVSTIDFQIRKYISNLGIIKYAQRNRFEEIDELERHRILRSCFDYYCTHELPGKLFRTITTEVLVNSRLSEKHKSKLKDP